MIYYFLHVLEFNMLTPSKENMPKRKAINLTIREDILKEAKALSLNASKAAESGILAAIKNTREQCWLEENKSAFMAHNKRVETEGPLLTPDWKA
jgi:antitoxin CcdA